MIYAAFIFWLGLILCTGIGLYRLWSGLTRSAHVNWALLPGTIVSEMAYIFGCLITGGEIRRAKLIDLPQESGPKRRGGGDSAEPGTEATARLKIIGPIVAALLAIVACAAAVLTVNAVLGQPVMEKFDIDGDWRRAAALTQRLPTSWLLLWDQLRGQVNLLQRTCETWARVDWLNWRAGLFAYLSLCLSIRLAPARRPVRATAAAAVVIAAGIGIVGLAWSRFAGLMEDIWPLLMYVWANLLLLVVVTLILRGLVALIRALAGKDSPQQQ